MELRKWLDGVFSEIEFWRIWMRTRGLFNASDFSNRLDPNLEIDAQAAALLPHIPANEIQVLDVGSGPISGFGLKHHGEKLNIRAADPLAPAYLLMYDKYAIQPTIPVELAFAEDLNAFYPKNNFNLVVCQNALDHTFDPWRSIRQMLEITCKDGHVLLRHARNEALNEHYSGLHQWNLDSDEQDNFILWNQTTSINVTQMLVGIAEVSLLESSSKHIVVKLRKCIDTPLFSQEENLIRLRDHLMALSNAAISQGRSSVVLKCGYALEYYGSLVMKKISRRLALLCNSIR